MGKPSDPAYWRRWRAAHPEYRAREAARSAERKRVHGRGDRTEEYRRRAARRPKLDTTPLPLLYPDAQRGAVLSFWRGELNLDCEQERALALLEGRDPDEAVRAYRSREWSWWAHTAPVYDAAADD